MTYRLDMNEQERAQLIGLLDLAVKAGGIKVAEVALALLTKVHQDDAA